MTLEGACTDRRIAMLPVRMVLSVHGNRSCSAGVICHEDLGATIRSHGSEVSALKQEDVLQEVSVTLPGAMYVGFLDKQSQLEPFPAGSQCVISHLFW